MTSNWQGAPSRQQIVSWLRAVLPDISPHLTIEELGKGVVYCRIINHYFPGVIALSRIIQNPKTEYQNMLNLKIMQNACNQLNIVLPIDPLRLSKQKLNDNWNLVLALHKYLIPPSEDAHSQTPEQTRPTQLNNRRPLEPLFNEQSYFNRPAFYPSEPYSTNAFNGSKYSVGRVFKESVPVASNSPIKGKWSVNSHIFQNNFVPIIDRVKQILLKPSHDIQKIRQIKMLLNVPLNEDVVKVQQDENSIIKIKSGRKQTGIDASSKKNEEKEKEPA